MAMNRIKKTNEYKLFKRGDGRFAVRDASGKSVNGEEKIKILLSEALIKTATPAEPGAEESVAEEKAVIEEAAGEAEV